MSAPFFHVSFSTALGFASKSLIKVGLIRELWFIPLAYISKPHPPPRGEAFKPRSQKIKRSSSPPEN
jgi:hypothetical protein